MIKRLKDTYVENSFKYFAINVFNRPVIAYLCSIIHTKEMSDKRIIYALKDPNHSTVRYVGKSIKGESRPEQHLVESHNAEVREWINGLKSTGQNAIIDVLEIVPPNVSIDYREKFWIHFYQSRGNELFNKMLLNSYEDMIEKSITPPASDMEVLGFAVRDERIRRGLSQDKLGEELSISRSTISILERGENVRMSTLLTFCRYLNLSLVMIPTENK